MSKKRTPEGDAFAALSIAVLRLSAHLQAEGDALAKPAGQTSARWQVLAAADHAPMSVADAARTLGLARQGVQRIADLLEGEGLIAYRANPVHQRAKLMELTDAGKRALADISARQAVWANAHGAAYGEERLRHAASLINQIIASFQDSRD
ncbi:DNA-binding MarR family transcriptional regulator [Rhizobium sp. BK650]|uniref:MarR family winged helix-turn-helix transcriptional regulator n=1 Tax=Rhizobium sp. BK650 TaxID=2586990 RepID=UPI001614539C|nr:MarR family winged helix-turn-helix transcriptional regulator [Rhizobium sp. BK650]MBB3658374.1 DNA-binding MarR family transcriptional regulator [Rhizobium sp. BK650]